MLPLFVKTPLVVHFFILLMSGRISRTHSTSTTTSTQVYSSEYNTQQKVAELSSQSQSNNYKNVTGNATNSRILASVNNTTHSSSFDEDATSLQFKNTTVNKSTGSIKQIYQNTSELDKMETEVNRSISDYIKNMENITLAERALNTTLEYVTLLNSSIQTLQHENNETEDGEEKSYMSLKQVYETKFKLLSKRLMILRNIQTLAFQYYNITKAITMQHEFVQKYNITNDLNFLKDTCTVTRRIISMMEDQINRAHVLNNLTGPGKMERIFSTRLTEYLRNIKSWERFLQKYRKSLSEYEQSLNHLEHKDFIKYVEHYVLTPLQAIIFLIGFVGNVILLVIFFKTRELRIGPNVMVLNLAIADSLHLLINIPVFFLYFTSEKWEAGLELCIIFRFFKTLCKYVSVYAVVAISLQKLFVLTNAFFEYRNRCHLTKRFKEISFILSVWLVGCLLTLPITFKIGIYKGNCYNANLEDIDFSRWISLYDLFMLCIIPGLIIMVTSIMNSYRLKKSIQQIPGESVGHDKVKRAREVSSNILLALTVVFLISYCPFQIYITVASWCSCDIEKKLSLILAIVFYNLMFFNSCFNPIAIYIVSRKYRNYFKRHILGREEPYRSSEYNSRSTKTLISTV